MFDKREAHKWISLGRKSSFIEESLLNDEIGSTSEDEDHNETYVEVSLNCKFLKLVLIDEAHFIRYKQQQQQQQASSNNETNTEDQTISLN